jgi:hypothetical protein
MHPKEDPCRSAGSVICKSVRLRAGFGMTQALTVSRKGNPGVNRQNLKHLGLERILVPCGAWVRLNRGYECNRLWVLKKSLRLAGEIRQKHVRRKRSLPCCTGFPSSEAC